MSGLSRQMAHVWEAAIRVSASQLQGKVADVHWLESSSGALGRIGAKVG